MKPDEHFMRKALRLAARGAGLTSPNPMVGAVVVRDGVEISSGWHCGPGSEHAEVVALRRAKDARGCDLYVNLEPCCHDSKRTPPCVPFIIKSGIRRVVVGMSDPNPLVSGRGIQMLREAGIEVEVGVLEHHCHRLNAAFAKWVTTGRPLVTLKMAITLDGRVADRNGKSRWITSEVSRRQVHRMRASSDAVMVGVGTVIADDPLLLPTMVKGGGVPLRVIVDGDASVPIKSRLVETARQSPVIVAAREGADRARVEALMAAGIELWHLPKRNDGVDLDALMVLLGSKGVTSVLVEGGPTLAASMLRAGHVDRLLLFVAPILLGDPKAPGLVADMGVRDLASSLSFVVTRTSRSGPDIMLELAPSVKS